MVWHLPRRRSSASHQAHQHALGRADSILEASGFYGSNSGPPPQLSRQQLSSIISPELPTLPHDGDQQEAAPATTTTSAGKKPVRYSHSLAGSDSQVEAVVDGLAMRFSSEILAAAAKKAAEMEAHASSASLSTLLSRRFSEQAAAAEAALLEQHSVETAMERTEGLASADVEENLAQGDNNMEQAEDPTATRRPPPQSASPDNAVAVSLKRSQSTPGANLRARFDQAVNESRAARRAARRMGGGAGAAEEDEEPGIMKVVQDVVYSEKRRQLENKAKLATKAAEALDGLASKWAAESVASDLASAAAKQEVEDEGSGVGVVGFRV